MAKHVRNRVIYSGKLAGSYQHTWSGMLRLSFTTGQFSSSELEQVYQALYVQVSQLALK